MLNKKIFALMPLTLVVTPFIAVSCGKTTAPKDTKKDTKTETSKENKKPTNIVPIDMSKNINNLETISKNKKNVVVFFADSLVGNSVANYVNNNDAIKKDMQGFTAYDNIVSSNYTNLGVPAIVGGWDYTLNEQKYGKLKDVKSSEILNQAYDNMMGMMEKAGYAQQWHAMQYYNDPTGTWAVTPENAMSRIGKGRNITVTDSKGINKNFKKPETDGPVADLTASVAIKDNIKAADTEKPMFKFIFSEATHLKFARLENNKAVEGDGTDIAKNKSMESTIGIFQELVSKIKSFGDEVYDNTMIVFVSDHGAAHDGADKDAFKYSSDDMKKFVKDFDKYKDVKEAFGYYSIFRNNPSLMMKPFKSNGAFNLDHKTLLSIYDVPQLIKNELNENGSKFDYDLNKSKNHMYNENPLKLTTRTLDVYNERSWAIDKKYGRDHTIPEIALQVKDSIFDINNWKWSPFIKEKNWQAFPKLTK
ncbi:sulfatase-like hydrolase/transferase [Mycoplasma todarodis]|uniref:Sulfatase N-terminal domain-containing protein n=1 Tax=Mycoplasma todarodis TaxID=1937191 RepID=A0A4R0XQE9_9MOLU|nr:sulfatase-like hydrolase/transferase [Mycoplasma todarodis]TCG11806.1 hypothetical protein C4B25_00595 [Mycoplasma todarodis]